LTDVPALCGSRGREFNLNKGDRTVTQITETSSQLTVEEPQNLSRAHDASIEHHYVGKDAMLKSHVHGTPVTAVCGVRYVVRSDPVTAGTGGVANVCVECARRYDLMGAGPA
jgi:hypothetical protein